ncbi:M64 family metallopeptidase [Streptomyces sp. N2-109]|uniref:M64 family metallopeptidase n=1 Tax=Streptomyces gossypii TaxID=2883101 RepID=A0ABT2K2U1_9ACTN|nr:M64 family metallopeptidase [Streptomyces gossypii]MCT2593860.1 M64 family metallopeptidase [Streptomyces gossypii]
MRIPDKFASAATAAALLGVCVTVAPSATAEPARASAAEASVAEVTDAATVVPVQTTGPADRRFNLVVLGDGYTADQLPEFRADIEKHLNVLWSQEPFASYRSYINVWAVETPSAESGVDCDPSLTSPHRDTPLDMGFWGGCNADSVQRLLTVDSRKAAALADLVSGTESANRQIVALGNSDTYGGAGGTYATASGGNALSTLITPHEIGHSLGKLQDEYDYYARGEPGGTYTGDEPASRHHTLLTEDEMRAERKKWWRWLGEESLSGGTIGGHEGGLYQTKGVWRPSEHSMMKSLGYSFDQVEREVMTQAITDKVDLVEAHAPNAAPVRDDRTLWVDTLHPVGGELSTNWTVDGKQAAKSVRTLDLRRLDLSPGKHTVTATVTDPTSFVRDPAIRETSLTRRVTWTVQAGKGAPPTRRTPVSPEFTGHTATDTPVGAESVVYADTTHPTKRTYRVQWKLDGRTVHNRGNDRDLDLGALKLRPGTHTLTARIPGTKQSLKWAVDATAAKATYDLSEPLHTVHRPGRPAEYVYDGPFTMKLTSADDQDGHVISQFRVNGDGWYTYYGWPTDADAPFRFTPGGTVIDDLVYGKLGSFRGVPWDDATPEYGTHTVEYRTIDAAGNISTPRSFRVTLLEK